VGIISHLELINYLSLKQYITVGIPTGKEMLEDAKCAIRRYQVGKDGHCNGKKKKSQKINND